MTTIRRTTALTLSVVTGVLGTTLAVDTTARAAAPARAAWAQVSAGMEYESTQQSTCGVRVDHTLWCWGDNRYGQLGLGDRLLRRVPSQVDGSWLLVDVGGQSACGIRSDATLWCWGENTYGLLGQGNRHGRSFVPVQVGTDADWAGVSIGYYSACGVRTDGTLWCWGWNKFGNLGLGDRKQRHVPTKVGTDTDWHQVSAGSADFACAIKTGGTLWCWGRNDSGQLGMGDRKTHRPVPLQVGTDTDWQAVSSGSYSPCATKSDASLWCWGGNDAGQLGTGDKVRRLVPTQIGTDRSWATVDTGAATACGWTLDGEALCWGYNHNGQLGVGDTRKRLVPTQVAGGDAWTAVSAGSGHTCGVKSDATLWCWGDPAHGQLGVGGRTDDTTIPVQVFTPHRGH